MGVNKGFNALYHLIDLTAKDVDMGYRGLYNNRTEEGLDIYCPTLLNGGACGDNDCGGKGGDKSGVDDATGEIRVLEDTKASEVAMWVEVAVGCNNHPDPPPPPPTAPQRQ